jgi:alkanesulfonate monooxygenase SsuD/methylene tetrahydromethanopterin reductase-like flavin-dependent oxidoreductase (luciferase family)
VVEEFAPFGVGPTAPAERVQRLRETLEVLRALWSGEVVDLDGEHHHLAGAQQVPVPLGRIPIVIGGTGRKTMALVREYADWWNVHIGALHRVEELRADAGTARVSIQQMVTFVPRGGDRAAITEVAQRRFGYARPATGTGPELVEHYGRLAEQGVERVYAWFTDFAPAATLDAFGAEVLAQL